MNIPTDNLIPRREPGGIDIGGLNTQAPKRIIPLPFNRELQLRGIAFDGSFFYVTAAHERVVYKLDKNFALAASVQVGKPYTAICYDTKAKVFWAAEDAPAGAIYKLNRKLECIGQLDIGIGLGMVQGLSYNCKRNALLAALQDSILEVAIDGGHAQTLKNGDFAAVLSIAPYYTIAQHRASCYSKMLIFEENGRQLKCINIPGKYTIKDILLYPCASKDRFALDILILAAEKCSGPVILQYAFNICDIALDSCNYKLCKDKETHHCKHVCCKLMESVALIEAAMAHILNAEGEKLQKAVQVAASVSELLEVNRSVSQTITDAAVLESMLVEKLKIIHSICQGTSIEGA